MTIRCPAKINTFLAVGPKDRRGFHPLRTVFQAVSLFDEMILEPAEEFSFSCNVPLPEENTVTRMARLLKEVVDVPALKVSLIKNIPQESGLGGGSSDAAGFVRGVAKITRKQMSDFELNSVAASVGADVPFFLVGGKARGEGYGQKLTRMPDSDVRHLVIVKPEVSCSTKDMFTKLDALTYDWRDFGDDFYNDFERVCPCESLEAIERLRSFGADHAGLTGSGSAVFGFFESEGAASLASDRALDENLGASWAVRTLSRSESLN